MFVLPGFRKIPFKLKVPYLPSGRVQCENVMKLLKGRQGRLVDLGSGDGRLVLTAASMGLQCTGYELNPILLLFAKTQARWRGISHGQATFVNKDFWMADMSSFNNVTIFLAPNVMGPLEQKLSTELPEDARVIACRFPFPNWPPTCSEGSGLDQVWAYDMKSMKKKALLHKNTFSVFSCQSEGF
ncbi:hypothetical protein NDU88_005192 [Pleurodeles waltl]|uniref:Uncharacterized protein n=3 Tax=Pleurodeles waltl TaxID=8319 RepID=A0AAV7WC08_PLEWA|nr:hypothetical protein NDU88_005192 [Pleurodeles waltl]